MAREGIRKKEVESETGKKSKAKVVGRDVVAPQVDVEMIGEII